MFALIGLIKKAILKAGQSEKNPKSKAQMPNQIQSPNVSKQKKPIWILRFELDLTFEF